MKTKTIIKTAIPAINILSAYSGNIARAYEIAQVGGQTVFAVAGTIARMAFSEVIRIEHLAEAIQYRALQRVETTKIYQV